MTTNEKALMLHKEWNGKLETVAKSPVKSREDLSIAFQHEIDHLNGILFYDRINKKKPFFTEDEIRLIQEDL